MEWALSRLRCPLSGRHFPASRHGRFERPGTDATNVIVAEGPARGRKRGDRIRNGAFSTARAVFTLPGRR
jgi:hypothetical protein